ncbi:MAG: hypothetical protein HFE86_06640 [Clostridiales bacterium]|nr:hypothetical protein [Clostridiales bacterium]
MQEDKERKTPPLFKKSVSLTLVLAMACGISMTLSAAAPVYRKGDLNGDGRVEIGDVMEACKLLARKSAGQGLDIALAWACDMNGDGQVRIDDVMEMCKWIARAEGPGPVYPPSEWETAGWALMELVESRFTAADGTIRGNRNQDQPAFLWPYGVYVSVLSEACGARPQDQAVKERYTRALGVIERYNTGRPSPGCSYAAAYGGVGDVYYDDNIWIVIEYLKACDLLDNPLYLEKAKAVMEYVYSGWDNLLGGGIYWCENQKTLKGTCSNAPVAYASAGLYARTGDARYLRRAEKIYDWTKRTLLDESAGLYNNHMTVDGELGRAKYAYNDGCMLLAALSLYRETGREAYLQDAQRLGQAACGYYFTQREGVYVLSAAAGADPWFAAWLSSGFMALAAYDPEAIAYVEHMESAAREGIKARDEQGFVYSGWRPGAGDTGELLHQCGTARLLLELANWRRANG